MADVVTVDPRYLKYDKDDVERLLDKVNNTEVATDESVRSIVKKWMDEPGE
jgi:hypothetical protein